MRKIHIVQMARCSFDDAHVQEMMGTLIIGATSDYATSTRNNGFRLSC